MPNATTNAILDNARAALPGVSDDVIELALFNVCDDLAREALVNVSAPADVDADPATWLPSAQWVPNFQVLLAGTLASLYGQFGKPYFSGDLAKYHLDKYLAYRVLSRTTDSGTTTHTNTPHERLLGTIRAQIPNCRDETIHLEMFAAIDCIAVDGFNLPPLDPSDTFESWLTATQYSEAFNAILTGTLYRLYGQAGMPWYSEPGYQANYARYQIELHKVRSTAAAATTAIDTISERLISQARAQIPNVTDEAVQLALFDAVNQTRIDGFRLAAITGASTTPASWLTVPQYEQGYLAISAGLMAALYAQPAMAWSSPDLAAAFTARFGQELHKVRSTIAGTTTALDTAPERLVSTARAEIPNVTDAAIQLALYATVNQVRVDAYRLAAIPVTNITPATWLTASQYEQSYLAIFSGMLAALYAQPAMPWVNLDLANAQATRFQTELHKIRSAVAGTSAAELDTVPDRLVSTARAEIPNVTDEAVELALYATVTQVRYDGFNLPKLAAGAVTPASWLTAAQYEQAYNAIHAGLFAALYAQPAMAWASPDLSAAHAARFSQELHKVRSATAGAVTSLDAVTERFVSTARAQIPGVTDEAVKLALFDAVSQVATDGFNIAPPSSLSATPSSWLTAPQYEQAYSAIIAGLMAALYAQPAMPWVSPDLSAAYVARFATELHKVRAATAGAAASVDAITERFVSTARAEIPLITDEAVTLALFDAVSMVSVDGFNIPPPASTSSTHATWLTVAQYNEGYQAIFTALMARLYAQTSMPWGNLDLTALYATRYANELQKVRSSTAGGAGVTDTVPERLISFIRAQIPGITDGAVELALFEVVNQVVIDAYRLPALDPATASTTWLTADQYEQSYNAISAGLTALIYGQAAMPWANAELSAAQAARFGQELHKVRAAIAGATTSLDAVTERFVSTARAQIPNVTDEAIKLAMFDAVSEVATDGFNQSPPSSLSSTPATWLTAPQYEQAYPAIIAGLMAALYAQPAMPWASPDLSAVYTARFATELHKVRAVTAGAATSLDTITERFVSAARAQIPLITDEAVELALFDAVSLISVDGFNQAPPASTTTAPASWLTVAQYNQGYQAIFAALLAGLYAQSSMPWVNLDLAALHAARYANELQKVRSTTAGGATTTDTIPERLVSGVRAQVPGITDEAVELALFEAVNQIVIDAYRLPPLDPAVSSASWLTGPQYEQSYQAISAGLLALIYAQAAMPWANAELAATQTERAGQELHKVRAAIAGTVPETDTIPERLVSAARAQIPNVTDEAVELALFEVINQLAIDAYRLPALDPATAPSAWLTAAQYKQSYAASVPGLMSALYSQPAVPWANAEIGAAYSVRFASELHKVRSAVAGTITTELDTVTDRLVSTVRAEIPNVTDEAVELALYATVNQVRADAYRLGAIPTGNISPPTWLTAPQYEQSYLAIFSGMLSALYAQPAMAWANAELSAVQATRFAQELHKVRAAVAGGTPAELDTIPERLVSMVRAQIPHITDEAIELALFDTANKVRIDAYRLAPLASAVGGPAAWLTLTQYEESWIALNAGLFAALYAQPAQAWTSPELAALQAAKFAHELQQLRSAEAGTTTQVDTIVERIISAVRAEIPEVRDAAINLPLFSIVSRLRVEALRQPALTVETDPATFLTATEYAQCYQAILPGVLALLYAQAHTAWFSDALHQAKWAMYQAELVQVRAATAGSVTSTDTIIERVVSSVRAQIPIVRDEAVNLEIFNTVNRIRVDAYRLAPLLGSNTASSSWLTTEQYEQSYNALIAGTLAAIFGQSAMPWFNQDRFVANEAKYLQEVNHLRVVEAGTVVATDTIPERLVSTVRAQIQLVRDESVQLAMFNIANKIRAEVYSLDPLGGTDTDYTAWLTVAQYEQSYLAVLYGTLAQLYGQSNMPWYSHEQYLAHNILFQQELDLARSENIEVDGPTGGVLDDILEEARTYLPGARDEVMEFELRRVLDEFLKFTQIWQEEVEFDVTPDSRTYVLNPLAEAEIVRVLSVTNATTWITEIPFAMPRIPTLTLKYEPSAPGIWLATCALSILTSKRVPLPYPNWGVPDWILERWDEVLLNGLLWRMMMQQGKSYTNTELGLFHGQRWRAGLADARGATRQQNVYDGQTWQYPAYA